LYDLQYTVAAFDELHQLRKMGVDARAAMAIAERSHSSIGMTATPVFTSSLDLVHEAAVLQLPGFMYEFAKEEAQKVNRMIRAGRKENKGLFDITAADDAPSNVSRTFLYHKEAIRYLRKRIVPHTIRRTVASVDRYGLPLVPVFPLTVCRQLVTLSKTEDRVLSELASIVINQQGEQTQEFVNHVSRPKFFQDYRMCLIHCGEPVSLQERWQELTLEQYRQAPSSKMDAVVAILEHHAGAQQSAAPVGSLPDVMVPPPPDPVVGYTRPTKIVVYVHHTAFVNLIAKVFALHGFPRMTFTGDTPIPKWNALLRDFNQERAHISDDGRPSWVLIISSIGSTGLNVPRACVMIYMEQVWSAAEERQINGRLCRSGQSEHVFVYTPLAAHTTDVIMSSMAHGKEQMLRAFTCPKGECQVATPFRLPSLTPPSGQASSTSCMASALTQKTSTRQRRASGR
ncbi:hypothetical protein BOTBODRAFT_122279, partial [Botryobasidium botryosum FD-172 SS1]